MHNKPSIIISQKLAKYKKNLLETIDFLYKSNKKILF